MFVVCIGKIYPLKELGNVLFMHTAWNCLICNTIEWGVPMHSHTLWNCYIQTNRLAPTVTKKFYWDRKSQNIHSKHFDTWVKKWKLDVTLNPKIKEYYKEMEKIK